MLMTQLKIPASSLSLDWFSTSLRSSMASEDERAAFSLTGDKTQLPIAAPFGLCLSLGLYFLLIQYPNTPIGSAIKLANGVIQASSAFKYINSPSPSPAIVIFASKVVIKGFKFSRRLIPPGASWGPSPSPIATRNLKGFVAAVNLVRCALHPPHADMPMGIGFLNSGHKFSKNLLRVVDVFTRHRLDEVIRRSVDAFGLLFKALVVVSVIGERVGRNGGAWKQNRIEFWRVWDLRCGLCLICRRSYFDRIGTEKKLPCFRVLDFSDSYVHREDLKVSISELLSLSISIEDLDLPNVLQRL